MYKILVDDELFCDSSIGDLAIMDAKITLEVNTAGTLSFVIPPEHPKRDIISERTSIIQVYRDDETEPTFSGICVSVEEDFYSQRTVDCEGELTYFNDSIQRQARYEGKTVKGLLSEYLAIHNAQVESYKQFNLGIVTVEDPNDYISCYTNMETTMTSLKEDLVDDLDGYFRIRHVDGKLYLDYLKDAINTSNQTIYLGDNLIDYTSNFDTTDFATIIIPLGATLDEEDRTSAYVEGLDEHVTIVGTEVDEYHAQTTDDYISDSTAVATFGKIATVVNWSGINDQSILKTKAETYLKDTQFDEVSIEVKAVDLHMVDSSWDKFKILDQIRVISKPHGLDKYFLITKLSLDLNNPANDSVTLGGTTTKSLTASTRAMNDEALKRMDDYSESEILRQAKAQATQLITTADTGYVTIVPDEDGHAKEILITDNVDYKAASKVWRWNSGGFGYSSTGYDGEYGTAITMDGQIVADYIRTGHMSVDCLEGAITAASDVTITWQNVTDTDNVVTSDEVSGTYTKMTPIYYQQASTTAPSAPTTEITSTSTSANVWTTVVPTYRTDYYYFTCDQIKTKAGTLSCTPVVQYVQSDVATRITQNTITVGYINALGVTAKDISATTISGKKITSTGTNTGTVTIDNGEVTSANGFYKSVLGSGYLYSTVSSGSYGHSVTAYSIKSSGLDLTLATESSDYGITFNPSGIKAMYIPGSSSGTINVYRNIDVDGAIEATAIDTYNSGSDAISNFNEIDIHSNHDIEFYYHHSTYGSTWIQLYPSYDSTNSSFALATNYEMIATSFRTFSDKRLKDNIEDITNDQLKLFDKINAKTFTFLGSDIQHAGFIAQDVKQSLNDLDMEESILVGSKEVASTNEELYMLDYTAFIPFLWKAVQDLRTRVTELENEIATLKGTNENG